MIAAIDNTFLTMLLNPEAAARPNPETGKPVTHCKQRIEALIDSLSKKGGVLLVPAPALAEAASSTAAVEAYFDELQQYACIEVVAFDAMAAFEFGKIIRAAIAAGDKRSGQSGSWQFIKMDYQIVAIAVSRSVDVFYSDDARQTAFAIKAGLTVKSTWDLELPPNYAQIDISEQAEEPWPEQKKPPRLNDSEKLPTP